MITSRRPMGPWPPLEEHVEPKRRWIVLLLPAGNNTPTPRMLQEARYFDCVQDRLLSCRPNAVSQLVKQMEGLQEIGLTCLTDQEIEEQCKLENTVYQLVTLSNFFSLESEKVLG